MRNWIDLFETRSFRSDIGNKELIVWENPGVSTLRALTKKFDLRGIVDGPNLYVADANETVHVWIADAVYKSGKWQGAMYKSGTGPRHLKERSCYFYDPETIADAKFKDEWVSPEAERWQGIITYKIAPDLHVAMFENNDLLVSPMFTRLMARAERFYLIPENKPKTVDPEWADNLLRQLGETVEDEFMEGRCYSLAMVHNRLYGWPIYVMGQTDGNEIECYHAMVKHPSGKMLDIKGLHDPAALKAEWNEELIPVTRDKLISILNPDIRPSAQDIRYAGEVLKNHMMVQFPEIYGRPLTEGITYNKWWVQPELKKMEPVDGEHYDDLPIGYHDDTWIRIGYSETTETMYAEGYDLETIRKAVRFAIFHEGRPKSLEVETRDGEFYRRYTGIEVVAFANGQINEAAPKTRRHSIYITVYAPQLVIIKLPDRFMAAKEYARPILQMMKREYGALGKDVRIEGLAGYPTDQSHEEEHEVLRKLEAAFDGSSEYFKSFDLMAWDEASKSFVKVRKSGDDGLLEAFDSSINDHHQDEVFVRVGKPLRVKIIHMDKDKK